MAANPYDPVTTTDVTQLADDDWGLSLPPIRYKKYSGTSRFKSLCDSLRRHPRYVITALAAAGVIILLIVIIAVASRSEKPTSPFEDYGTWQNPKQGLVFYPKPASGSVVISFKAKDFRDLKDGPIEESLNRVIDKYVELNQLGKEVYVSCNNTYHPSNKICSLDTSAFGSYCTRTLRYGYEQSQPCVLFQLNLPDGQLIKPISNESPLWQAAESVMKEHTDPSKVPITCEGKNEEDKKVINSQPAFGRKNRAIDYFPYDGFPSYIYRQRNTSLPFIKPAVMVQVTNMPDEHLIRLKCTAWGQLYDEKDKQINHALLTAEFGIYEKM